MSVKILIVIIVSLPALIMWRAAWVGLSMWGDLPPGSADERNCLKAVGVLTVIAVALSFAAARMADAWVLR